MNRSGYLDIQSRALLNKIVSSNASLLIGIPLSLTSHSNAFAIGAHMETLANLRVHSKPSTENTIGIQGIGAFGTIVAGPFNAQGYTWWQIKYDLGISGWSAQNYLQVVP